MDPNQADHARSFGRGRPLEYSDLRRPFPNTTYAATAAAAVPQQQHVQYVVEVPAEGSNNILNMSDMMNRQSSVVHNGDHGGYHMNRGGDFAHSQNIIYNAGNDKNGSEVNSVLSPYAPVFVPRNFRPEPRADEAVIPIDTSNDSYPIQKLRQFLFEITLNPGKFESKIEQLVDCFNDFISHDDTMRAVVNIVFDESVRQPNFRYNGARLSKYLCKDFMPANSQTNFMQLLLARCNQEQKRREDLVDAEDGGAYLRGFAMYLAELFSQLEVSHQKIKVLGDYLMAVIETLISNPSSDNLKCICQILKLVGVYVEDQERNKTPNNGSAPEMDKIIGSLSTVAKNQDFPKDIRSMVSNVVDLRSSNWGRGAEEEPVIEEIPPQTPLNEPVMYGPDGKPISDEESLFLHSQYSNNASDAEEYDGQDEAGYEEMSEEIQAAYEMYLKETNR